MAEERYCCCVPKKQAAIAIAVGSTVVSTVFTGIAFYLAVTYIYNGEPKSYKIYIQEINNNELKAVLFISAIFFALWSLFSWILLFGILKNKSSFFLAYFSYGVILTIMFLLGAMFLMLHTHWVISLLMIITSVFYVYLLIIVHSIYEDMINGKLSFDENFDDSITDILVLVEEEDDS